MAARLCYLWGQRAPGSAQQHPWRSLERAGEGPGTVPGTLMQWDKGHLLCSHCTCSWVRCCPSRLIFRGISCLFFPPVQAPLHSSKGTGLKPGCVYSVMDIHLESHCSEGSGSRMGGLDPGRSPCTHLLLRAHVPPGPSPVGQMWLSWDWLLAATNMFVAITTTFCSCKMIKSCLSYC